MNTFQIPQKLSMVLYGFIAIGVISLALGFVFEPQRGWAGLLVVAWYILILGLAGGFWAATQYVVQAKWSVVVRRIPENTVSVLPFAALLFIGVVFGMHHLYEWSHADVVAHDHVLQQKAGYLNPTFFMIRLAIYFIIWWGVAEYLKRLSRSQDESKDPAINKKLLKSGIVYLTLFAFSFVLAVTDLLMSLEPHWFTALYPMYNFAGMATTGISSMIILILIVKKNGGLQKIGPDHLHDMGKYLFAFNVFWAYTVFAMSMLTWFANMPEETYFLEKRFTGGWTYFTLFLWIFHFLVPFFYLLPRDTKRSETHLMIASWITAFMGFVDVVWMVYGTFSEGEHAIGFPPFGFVELGLFLGAAGLYGFVVLKSFVKGNQVPEGDPNLKSSIGFHESV